MLKFLYNNVVIEAFAVELPPKEVTSLEMEEKLSAIYKRLNVPLGTLEKLSGIKARRVWESDILPSVPATAAAQAALQKSSLAVDDIDVLINCSVSRDYFEPATAALVHRNLGLKENSICFDVTNACIGFSDGLIQVANMIEQGAARAGIVVTAEPVGRVLDVCIKNLLAQPEVDRDLLLKQLPTLTLGSSAVAFVVAHKRLAPEGHRLSGVVSRSASQHNELCMGNADFAHAQKEDFTPLMETESAKLISSAAKLGARTWQDASQAFGWSREDIDHIFCHQVGRQVNEAFYDEMGLDYEKEFTVYRTLGNCISAALPTAFVLGVEEKKPKKGEKILLTAFGSGLNCRFLAIEW